MGTTDESGNLTGPSAMAEELEAAVAENKALRAQAARSAALNEQHAQLVQRLKGERERADAAAAQREMAMAEVAALQQRVRLFRVF